MNSKPSTNFTDFHPEENFCKSVVLSFLCGPSRLLHVFYRFGISSVYLYNYIFVFIFPSSQTVIVIKLYCDTMFGIFSTYATLTAANDQPNYCFRVK